MVGGYPGTGLYPVKKKKKKKQCDHFVNGL